MYRKWCAPTPIIIEPIIQFDIKNLRGGWLSNAEIGIRVFTPSGSKLKSKKVVLRSGKNRRKDKYFQHLDRGYFHAMSKFMKLIQFQTKLSLFHKFSDQHKRWISLMYDLKNKSTSSNGRTFSFKWYNHNYPNYPFESVSSARNVCISNESRWFLSICDNEWHHALYLILFFTWSLSKRMPITILNKWVYHDWIPLAKNYTNRILGKYQWYQND